MARRCRPLEDRKHRRKVAIKVLRPELATDLGAEWFLREIQITAKLQHPNILTLIDSGEAAGRGGPSSGLLYYVMSYVEGESLGGALFHMGLLDEAERVVLAGLRVQPPATGQRAPARSEPSRWRQDATPRRLRCSRTRSG